MKKLLTWLICAFLLSGCEPRQTASNCPCPPKAVETDNAYIRELLAADHYLPRSLGEQYIKRFQEYVSKDSARAWSLIGSANAPSGIAGLLTWYDTESFNNAVFCDLLSLPGCVGLRMHYGLDENNQVRVLITGLDKNAGLLFLKRKRGNALRQQVAPTLAQGGSLDEEFYADFGRHP